MQASSKATKFDRLVDIPHSTFDQLFIARWQMQQRLLKFIAFSPQ